MSLNQTNSAAAFRATLIALCVGVLSCPSFALADHAEGSNPFSDSGNESGSDAEKPAENKEKEPAKKDAAPKISEAEKELNENLAKLTGGDEVLTDALKKALAAAVAEEKPENREKAATALLESLMTLDRKSRFMLIDEDPNDPANDEKNKKERDDVRQLLSKIPKEFADKAVVESFTKRQNENIKNQMGTKSALDEFPSNKPEVVGPVLPSRDADTKPTKPAGFLQNALTPFNLGGLGALGDALTPVVQPYVQPAIDAINNFFTNPPAVTPKPETAHNNGTTPAGENRPAATLPETVAKSGPTTPVGEARVEPARPVTPPVAPQTPDPEPSVATAEVKTGTPGAGTPPSGNTTSTSSTSATSSTSSTGTSLVSNTPSETGNSVALNPPAGQTSGTGVSSGSSVSTGTGHSGEFGSTGTRFGSTGSDTTGTTDEDFLSGIGTTGHGGSFIPPAINNGRVLNTNPSNPSPTGNNGQPAVVGSGNGQAGENGGITLVKSGDPSEVPAGSLSFGVPGNPVISTSPLFFGSIYTPSNAGFSAGFFNSPATENSTASNPAKPSGLSTQTAGILADDNILGGNAATRAGGEVGDDFAAKNGNNNGASPAGNNGISNTVAAGTPFGNVQAPPTMQSQDSSVRVTTFRTTKGAVGDPEKPSDRTSETERIAALDAQAKLASLEPFSSEREAINEPRRGVRTVKTGAGTSNNSEEEDSRDVLATAASIAAPAKANSPTTAWTPVTNLGASDAATVAIDTVSLSRAINGNRGVASLPTAANKASGAYRVPADFGGMLDAVLTGRGMVKPIRVPLKTQDAEAKKTNFGVLTGKKTLASTFGF